MIQLILGYLLIVYISGILISLGFIGLYNECQDDRISYWKSFQSFYFVLKTINQYF